MIKNFLSSVIGLFTGGSFTSFVACLLFGMAVGSTGAWRVQTWRHEAQRADELREAQRLKTKRDSSTDVLATKTERELADLRRRNKQLKDEVSRYVPPTDCPMSVGFRVLHDAAAAGELPDPARLVDGAPVPAAVVADTVDENYASCREDLKRFSALQDWIREQQKVK